MAVRRAKITAKYCMFGDVEDPMVWISEMCEIQVKNKLITGFWPLGFEPLRLTRDITFAFTCVIDNQSGSIDEIFAKAKDIADLIVDDIDTRIEMVELS